MIGKIIRFYKRWRYLIVDGSSQSIARMVVEDIKPTKSRQEELDYFKI